MGIMKYACQQANWMMQGMMDTARGMMPGALMDSMGDMVMPSMGCCGVRADVCEGMDAVFVVADLPGVEKENIAVRLLKPTVLEISGMRSSEMPETTEGGEVVRRERASGRMDRTVMLPSATTADGSTASFTNGVLKVRLRKAETECGERIPIE
jgi:HSP20 family protein